ncbi:uncharacterized protein Z520_06240 [Fonsecaea multimorphosa CBS 102226]|uniref:NADH-ubiquinone oxidoreductase 9.5 kDa subunit n=1 Tax=Fonsecaea multimorphosa CBS 102226 TaxID=1442371 RepID=A0A0D2H8H4_9EURO|nr:uncharacterized protein Z520_06240 [Fonsecaea multimorphosa CBS 102226]KIX98160.1 hypothetical protein Z520_06240 [Fonsecaea multimorphosa CBS 102226]
MSGVPQRFWGQPIRYLRWAAHEKPAIFWSCVIGGLGPATFVFIPPMRRYFGDQDPPRIPLTYPGTYLRVKEEGGGSNNENGGILQLWDGSLLISEDLGVVKLKTSEWTHGF